MHSKTRDGRVPRGVSGRGGILIASIGVLAYLLMAPGVLAQFVGDRGDAGRRFYPDDPIAEDPDRFDVPEMAEVETEKTLDVIQHAASRRGDPDGVALNINTLGEVPNSSWFTNRIGTHDMTVADLARGPDTVEGPAAGAWTVTGGLEAGVTPKFTIRDARGDTYMIKLDPVAFPELASSVEEISTKLFHAMGYWVPENFIVFFDAARLGVDQGATSRTETGGTRPIAREDVDHWLRDQPRRRDGSIRALASRVIMGKRLGEFRYSGTRPDDPNDLLPHERRRELRGLRVFAAWLNHDDGRSINTFDAYVEDQGRRHVRHYLLDFGSNVGSGSASAHQPRGGYEYLLDGQSILKGVPAHGFWQQAWTRVKTPGHPAVGPVESESSEPSNWKTGHPQPGFARMDAADAFWAASIVSRFTDAHIHAAVRTAAITDPAAAASLAEAIVKRRDKVVAHWITRTNPLDRFRVERSGPGGTWRLTFDNAAVRVGAASAAASYRLRWARLDNLTRSVDILAGDIPVTEMRADLPVNWGPVDDLGDRYLVAWITTEHRDYPRWREPVHVSLRLRGDAAEVVGISRPR